VLLGEPGDDAALDHPLDAVGQPVEHLGLVLPAELVADGEGRGQLVPGQL
jgi:hypothetical protein